MKNYYLDRSKEKQSMPIVKIIDNVVGVEFNGEFISLEEFVKKINEKRILLKGKS